MRLEAFKLMRLLILGGLLQQLGLLRLCIGEKCPKHLGSGGWVAALALNGLTSHDVPPDQI